MTKRDGILNRKANTLTLSSKYFPELIGTTLDLKEQCHEIVDSSEKIKVSNFPTSKILPFLNHVFIFKLVLKMNTNSKVLAIT